MVKRYLNNHNFKKVTPLYVDKYRGRGIPKKVLMVCMKEDMRKKEVK